MWTQYSLAGRWLMRKLYVFLMMVALTASLSAQSSPSNVFVYVSPAVGGTAEEREYFDFNLREEVKGGGYELTNALYNNPDEAWAQSDFYIDVELSYDREYDENIVTLILYNTRTGELLITSGMVYESLDEMYDWNLTLIYRVMANAPIAKRIMGAAWENDYAGREPWSWNKEPDHWVHLGLHIGPSIRFYTIPEEKIDKFAFGISFNVGLQAMVQVLPFLGIQAEAIFTLDNVPVREYKMEVEGENVNLNIYKIVYNPSSLMFPLMVKGTFRPGRFLIAPFVGMYFTVPLGEVKKTETKTVDVEVEGEEDEDGKPKTKPMDKTTTTTMNYKTSLPIGLTGGVNLGMRLGPGELFMDIRYSADLGNTMLTDDTVLYQRSMLSLSVGYSFKIAKKM
jgi:hypothetical protein